MVKKLLQPLWTVVLLLAVFAIFERGLFEIRKEETSLKAKIYTLQSQKEKVTREFQELLLEQKSLADPHYIELLLIRELGVLPVGKSKVLL